MATPGGTLHTAFAGSIVNFMMWDEAFKNYDVAFPSWKQLLVSDSL